MGTNDLLENLSVKRKSCRKVVEIRMDESRSLDVIRCVFEGKSSTNLREGSVWGGVWSLVRIQSSRHKSAICN